MRKRSKKIVQVSGLGIGDYVVSYTSANKKIASVNKAGKVTAKRVGTTNITVRLASGKTGTLRVTVKNSTKRLKVSPKSIVLSPRKSFQLQAKVTPSKSRITYKSSNKKVATVNSKGKVKAKKKGTATITVTSGLKKVKVKVTVR